MARLRCGFRRVLAEVIALYIGLIVFSDSIVSTFELDFSMKTQTSR
ncbi:hypothetical protein M218_23005 [Burkholderia pseudomallei MSHR338]|nr:hypothetical protein M218_23005 [Burkholderia pseudomallei MSHR338]